MRVEARAQLTHWDTDWWQSRSASLSLCRAAALPLFNECGLNTHKRDHSACGSARAAYTLGHGLVAEQRSASLPLEMPRCRSTAFPQRLLPMPHDAFHTHTSAEASSAMRWPPILRGVVRYVMPHKNIRVLSEPTL